MKHTTLLLFLVATLMALALVALVSRQRLKAPEQLLLEIQAALQTEDCDEQALLRVLDSSLRRVEAETSKEAAHLKVCADLRRTRGEIFLRIGATDKARVDFEYILSHYQPGDREVRRLLIQAESAEGQTDAALAHLRELLEDEPGFGPAWVELGLLEALLANQVLEQCDERLRFVLIEKDAASASGLLRRLAARDATDTRRATTILELRSLFPPVAEDTFGQVLGLCEQANVHFKSARKALVHSFSVELAAVAVTRYLEILEDARQDEEALQIGSLVALQGPDTAEPESAELLMRMLLRRGRNRNAAQLAASWINSEQLLNQRFLRFSCEALYLGEDWPTLARASILLRSIGDRSDDHLFTFYTGLALSNARNPQVERALPMLLGFASAESPEPFVGAREVAWTEVAALQQELGNTTAEREALQRSLELNPDNGKLWLRRAELQSSTPHGGYSLPLESWVQGMRRLPRNSEKQFDRFLELGQQRLAAEERDLEVLYEEMRRAGMSAPTRNYGPYVLWWIAQKHGELGDHVAQAAAAARLSDAYPDFIPALDQAIEARRALGDREIYIKLVLERVELAGATVKGLELLHSIHPDEFTPAQVLQAMRLDPRGIGRRRTTTWFAENGDNTRAIATLEAVNRKSRKDEEWLLGARLLMADGQYRAALTWVDNIPENSPQRMAGLHLAVRCALRAGDEAQRIPRMRALLRAGSLSPEETLALTDELFLAHEFVFARQVLTRFEPNPGEAPGPQLLRSIQLDLAEGALDAAVNTVERAAAFITDADYLIAKLLLQGQRGEWFEVAQTAESLRELPFAGSALRLAWIDLCTGGEIEALVAATEQQNPSTGWTVAENIARLTLGRNLRLAEPYGSVAREELEPFLIGNAIEPVDPRLVAIQMLAAESPSFQIQAIGTLTNLPRDERGRFWPSLLAGELYQSANMHLKASVFFERAIRSSPDCLVAWGRFEQSSLSRYGSILHPQVRKLGERRLAALAAADPSSASGLLLRARKASKQGDVNVAVRATAMAAKLDPTGFEARRAVASIRAAMGQWEAALDDWRSLIDDTRPIYRPLAFAGYMSTVQALMQLDPPPLSLARLKKDLDKLNLDYPGNPGCGLALARLDLRLDLKNPSLGLERAWSRLRGLREDHGAASLEERQRGATRAWASFYLETDPDSAETFILSELERQPGNVDLWRLLGRVQRELGQFSQSRRGLTLLMVMAPSSATQEELLETIVASGVSPQSVAKSLNELDRRRGSQSHNSRMLLVEALLADFNPKSWAEALLNLEQTWEDRHQLKQATQRTRLAQLLGRALLLRGDSGDAARCIEILTAALPETRGPYQREFFECLIGMASSRSLPSQ